MGTLSVILRESKPYAMRFFPLRVSTLLQGYPFSEPLFDVLLMGFPLFGAQALAYGLSTLEPTGRWIPCSFSLPGSFHPYSDDGIFLTRETALLGDFSHTEVNSTAGFTPTRRYQIVTPIYLGPQLGVDTSNRSLGDIFTSLFLQDLWDHGYSWHIVYIWGYEGFLFGLSSWHTSLKWLWAKRSS